MKILITGQHSFVGNRLDEWLKENNHKNKYEVIKQSVRNDEWKDIDYSQFDSVVHVAGIAHVSTDPSEEEKYFRVNRDLTYELAKKAKSEGVKHFIFLSSIIVYGDGKASSFNITRETPPNPSNFYGESKLQAEKLLAQLEDDNFKVALIRPPMIYGKDSKGNYPKLSKLARLLPIFPSFENERSMIHIDNLTEFIRLILDNQDDGIFYPQNTEYVQSKDLFQTIRSVHGKKTYLTGLFNAIIKLLVGRITVVNKLFGSLTYDRSISNYRSDYRVRSFEESIELTESK